MGPGWLVPGGVVWKGSSGAGMDCMSTKVPKDSQGELLLSYFGFSVQAMDLSGSLGLASIFPESEMGDRVVFLKWTGFS